MNPRERNLLIGVSSLVGIMALGFGLRYVFAKPLQELDKQIGVVRTELNKVNTERRNFFVEEDKVKALTQRTFSDNLDQASAKSGEMLTKLILQSGLEESDFTRLPISSGKLRGAHEIGWNIQGDGSLMQVVNLLFLLQESPYLHRIEGVTVQPAESVGRVRVRFRFLTLVISPAPVVEWREPAPKFTLDSPERRILDSIISRDILRPYIKRLPAPAKPGAIGSPGVSVANAKPLPGPESLRIVSLSEWEGFPEIHVRDLVNERTFRYKPGDNLAGGVIVMVDYRALPMPGNEALKSFSRVIIRSGNEYWAIERGRTLADKYKLGPEQLPEKVPGL